MGVRLAAPRARPARHNRRPDWPYRLDPGSDQARAPAGDNLGGVYKSIAGVVAWPMGVESAAGGVLRDLGGFGQDAALNSGAVIVADAEMTAACDFSASGASASVATVSADWGAGPFDQGRWTLAFWLSSTIALTSSIRPMLVCRTGATSNEGFGVILDGFYAGAISIFGKSASTSRFAFAGATTGLNDGKWHHVAVTFSRLSTEAQTIYVDGKQDATASSTGAWGMTGGPALRWALSPDSFWQHYTGLITDARWYDGWLAPGTIARLAAPRTRWDLYEPVRQSRLDLVPGFRPARAARSTVHVGWGFY